MYRFVCWEFSERSTKLENIFISGQEVSGGLRCRRLGEGVINKVLSFKQKLVRMCSRGRIFKNDNRSKTAVKSITYSNTWSVDWVKSGVKTDQKGRKGKHDSRNTLGVR